MVILKLPIVSHNSQSKAFEIPFQSRFQQLLFPSLITSQQCIFTKDFSYQLLYFLIIFHHKTCLHILFRISHTYCTVIHIFIQKFKSLICMIYLSVKLSVLQYLLILYEYNAKHRSMEKEIQLYQFYTIVFLHYTTHPCH